MRELPSLQSRQVILERIATFIAQRQLTVPARLILDVVAPVGVIASQTVLFVAPLIPRGSWREAVIALEEPESWQILQGLLHRAEC